MSVSLAKVDSFLGNSTSPALLADRACPVCGSLRHKTVLTLEKFQFFSDSISLPKRADIGVSQCRNCFTLFINPCYSHFGFSILFSEAEQSYGASKGRYDEQVSWLKKRSLLNADESLLDVGCYQGKFLALLPKEVERVGVEIDAGAIERGKAQFGQNNIQFIHGDFETFRHHKTFDVITMFHVLEHLPHPKEVLQNLRANSHKNTRLIVEVPILENSTTNDINGFFSVYHMTHFSRRSLTNCLSRAGWRVEEWFEQTDYNGCRVVAVSDIVQEEVKGEETDLRQLYVYLASWYEALATVEQRLDRIDDNRSCILWGAGMHTEFLYQCTSLFQRWGGREYAIVDNDPLKQGSSWRGISIYSPSCLKTIDWEKTWLLISSYGSQEIIAKSALELGVTADKIVKLYEKLRVY